AAYLWLNLRHLARSKAPIVDRDVESKTLRIGLHNVNGPSGHILAGHDTEQVNERNLTLHRLQHPDIVVVVGVGSAVSVSQQSVGSQLVIVRRRRASLGRSCCEGQRHLWKHRGLEYSLRPEQWHSLTLKLKTCRQQVTREDLTMKCGLISQELERRSTNSRIAGRRLICHRRVTIARAG